MSRKNRIFGVIVLAFLLYGCSQPLAYNWRDGEKICARIGSQNYLLEIARSGNAHSQGLQGRQELERGRGMLFVFDRASTQKFWMKKTLIPLDIIWFGADYAAIAQQSMPVEANPESPQNVYESPKPAQYAVEINQNETEVPVGSALTFIARDQCD